MLNTDLNQKLRKKRKTSDLPTSLNKSKIKKETGLKPLFQLGGGRSPSFGFYRPRRLARWLHQPSKGLRQPPLYPPLFPSFCPSLASIKLSSDATCSGTLRRPCLYAFPSLALSLFLSHSPFTISLCWIKPNTK